MLKRKFMYRSCLLIAVTSIAATSIRAAEFDDFVKPLLEQKCIKCHGGGKKVQGEVNFKQIATAGQFLEGPERFWAPVCGRAALGADRTGQGRVGPTKHRDRSQCPLFLTMLQDNAL